MGPATAGVSGNKGWAQSSFVLGEAPAQQETFIMQISLQPAASQRGVGEGLG